MLLLSGKQLQILAYILCILGIIGSVISGIAVCSVSIPTSVNPMYEFLDSHPFFAVGIGVMVVGSALSWAGCCFLYAIGRLVEDKQKILEKQEK